ncbi:extracellular solute-binding protein [Nakamurella aerolata]|uniref:Extracellular solute-binding protein n=1 Tax=Nakamurella aerolata TaxID=1656892 RepID=A0A849A570_9ACTN|nr:extracellular solute-binding protein [Nakamurella aerolata]NNG34786.1 extracellular solute-binding protein [Nakamurella aerolata]
MSHRLSRLVATTAAALVLAACGSDQKPASPAPGSSDSTAPVTLTFWGTYGNGGNRTQTDVLQKSLIPAFEAANPGVSVDYVDVPYDSFLQKLETSASGGQLPDLIRADLGWVPRFADDGALEPLDTAMPNFQKFADKTYPGSLATNKWEDHYYGLPLDTNTRVLISNPEALAKAGLSKPPKTIEELVAAGPKLAEQNVSVFADSGLQTWNVLPWIWSGGGSLTDEKLTTATGYLDSPETVAAVQMLVDLYQQQAIPNLITGNKGGTPTSDGLPKGSYATILDGPWMAGVWSGQYPDFEPTYSPMPEGKGGSISVVGGENIVLTAESPNKDAALKFIEFTQGEQFQLEMAATGQMPSVVGLGDAAAKKYPELAPFAEQLKTARSRPAVPDGSKIDTILNDALTQAFTGKASVKDALTEAAKQIDPLLSPSS